MIDATTIGFIQRRVAEGHRLSHKEALKLLVWTVRNRRGMSELEVALDAAERALE